jgi:hypothetical protein
MQNKQWIQTLPVIGLLLLTACGGSEGGDQNSHSSMNASSPSAALQTTIDLQAQANFDFASEFKLILDIDIGSQLHERSYINICPGKAHAPNEADYGNCTLQAPLIDGQLLTEVLISNDTQHLFADIWPITQDAVPLRFEWHYQAQDTPQLFEIR